MKSTSGQAANAPDPAAGPLARQYCDEIAARRYLEARLWPEGPVCPHCGTTGKAAKLTAAPGSGSHARAGACQCRSCRRQFSITVGTIFQDSHIPLHKWLKGIYLMCSAKGVSALELQRRLELGSYRSAWFMCRRIEWALTQKPMKRLVSGRSRGSSGERA